MIRSCVLTTWENLDGANVAKIALDYTLPSCEDVTAQPEENMPPTPNLCVWQITCDDATLAQIEADERFCVLEVEE